ncbi:23S rRNA (uracil-5-)-methyltransferase RumA [Synergistales bacterium]|nr:23S rRNA (uracil-5-)-methyltransferase RumA [Synergistales bacterium]
MMMFNNAERINAETPCVMELTIEKISSDGSGIARTNDGVIFVRGALPGEIVEAEVFLRKKDYSIARVVSIKTPNPRRVTPRCRIFSAGGERSCGGCQLQHASYELQLEIKKDILKDALNRIGGIDLAELSHIDCVASPERWGYRNKASFPIRKISGRPTAGYYAENSHYLIPLRTCPVNAEPINRLFETVQREMPSLNIAAYDERIERDSLSRDASPGSATKASGLRHLVLRSGMNTGQTLMSFVVAGRLDAQKMKNITSLGYLLRKELTTLTLNHNSRPGNTIHGDRTEILCGDGMIEERLDAFTLTYDTTSFFQINTKQAVQLYRYVANIVRESGAGNILELYSGVGSLTCFLHGKNSARQPRLVSVEDWTPAVVLMEDNLERNGITDVDVEPGKAENVISTIEIERDAAYDMIVLDPPRAGCERAVLDGILKLSPKRVVYVSCNPSTLARDAKVLRVGGYAIKSVKAFDMFPQTLHVETVVLLEKL